MPRKGKPLIPFVSPSLWRSPEETNFEEHYLCSLYIIIIDEWSTTTWHKYGILGGGGHLMHRPLRDCTDDPTTKIMAWIMHPSATMGRKESPKEWKIDFPGHHLHRVGPFYDFQIFVRRHVCGISADPILHALSICTRHMQQVYFIVNSGIRYSEHC